jgi:hypothetical protein
MSCLLARREGGELGGEVLRLREGVRQLNPVSLQMREILGIRGQRRGEKLP